ncbi:MAG: hypothetical protein ACTHJK_03280 [Sphingomicrobium sp.]
MLIGAVAAIFWPGVAMYDTVAQYGQVLSNDVDDWHPPIMVRLWQALHPLATGDAPMFTLQVALYAAGFALIVAALVRSGHWRAAIATAILALSPLLLGWQMVVLKDGQMLGALLAAFGIAAHYRLSGRPVPILAAGAVALLLAYATLVRANAVFATVPLAVLLLPIGKRPLLSAVVAAASILVVVAASPAINHRLLGAAPSGVEKSLPLFDLAAIAVATPASPSPFTRHERGEIVRKHCVKSFFWDPLGDPIACGPVTDRLNQESDRTLYIDLAVAIAAHPLAYIGHRLKHWNSTERWLVPPDLPEAAPPDESEQNDVGLRNTASPLMPAWQSVAAAEAGTPLGWPIVWTVVALLFAPVGWRRRNEAAGGLAFALLASALVLEASFLVVSIASDFRYHLWTVAAVPLALILLSRGLRLSRPAWVGSALLIAAMIAGGLITRSTLPAAPSEYEAMVQAPSG